MTVEVLEPHGFCGGVKAALARARAVCSEGRVVHCLHELVHNETVVAALRAEGMTFVSSPEEVPEGGTVLFSAHGVAPEARRAAARRRLTVVDATCPFVMRVHRQVADFATRGIPVVVVGDARHVEVAGVVGEVRAAGGCAVVVGAPGEVASVRFPENGPVGVVCQTTLSSEVAQVVLDGLRTRYSRLLESSAAEVCTATRDRQDAVRAFVACGGDAVLVLGSAKSSNTRRLAEVASAAGARTWRVADAVELAACDFSGVVRLGVTSGASTPEDFFDEVLRRLSAMI